jgi:hypothetical protein
LPAAFFGSERHLSVRLDRDEEDRRGEEFADFFGGGEAVHSRHVDVENNEVWLEPVNFVNGVETVDGFATNL